MSNCCKGSTIYFDIKSKLCSQWSGQQQHSRDTNPGSESLVAASELPLSSARGRHVVQRKHLIRQVNFILSWWTLDPLLISGHSGNNMASIGRLSTKDAVVFLCDMQEKFRPNIFQFTNIVSNAARVLQASRVLGIPHILTEQYPKGLGPTVPELGASDLTAHAKTSFTMMIEAVEKQLQALGNPKQAILCGIEAHACIACTTFDLLEKGMEVHIVADAVSSRSQTDRLFALSRLKQSGAYLTTTEAVLLQLVQDAKHPNFKEIQKLLAHPSPDTGLVAFFSSL